MTHKSPLLAAVSLCLSLLTLEVHSQNCDDPQLLCSQTGNQTANTSTGTSVTPPSGCTSAFENAVFFEFQTLDQNQFPDVAFDDPTATVSISGIICDEDTLLSQSVNIALFTATDLCDASSFSSAIGCEANVTGNLTIELDNLSPSTTYYIMVSGSEPTGTQTGPGSCEVSASVTGPAIEYDLDASFHPEGDPDRNVVFEGETVVLNADDQFPDMTWTGEALNSNNGSSVTADPEGVGESFLYTVNSTINDCPYSDQVEVTIFPAVVPYTGFTPNGDGINDTWEIRNIHIWPNAQIIVYSRWGTKVFQAVNYNNDWDGDDLPAATYYYVIELNPVEFNVEPYTGSVTIMR